MLPPRLPKLATLLLAAALTPAAALAETPPRSISQGGVAAVSPELSAISEPAPYASVPSALNVDLRDVAAMSPHLFPDAKLVLRAIELTPVQFGIEPGTVIHGVELIEPPQASDIGTQARILMHLAPSAGKPIFRKADVSVAGQPRQVVSVQLLQDVAVADTSFAIRVSLIQRKAIVEDRDHGIRKIYPLNVGGIDPGLKPSTNGQTVLMTPTYKDASIGLATSMARRDDPKHFRNLPFMRLVRNDGYRSPIAFHIVQGKGDMQRSFQSHGCMHLRKKDLLELYSLLAHSGPKKMSVDVAFLLDDAQDHPLPHNDQHYQTVINCARKGQKPRYCRDSDDLTQMGTTVGRPPFEALGAMAAENMDPRAFAEIEQESESPGEHDDEPLPPPLPPMIRDALSSGRSA